ncbi:hypothetical protein FQR65_LT11688 [Abscondita terminalis]|nr:hypothetical protein FQR65_LT11688 [Abscondita terminalis]
MIEPYYSLIEGGLDGWLFKEMQDLFYYMQILHQGENTVLPRIVSDYIPVSEFPDLMRAVGIKDRISDRYNMLIDQKYRDYDETKILRDDVIDFKTFLEDILGVDLEREMVVEEEAAKVDRDDELEC